MKAKGSQCASEEPSWLGWQWEIHSRRNNSLWVFRWWPNPRKCLWVQQWLQANQRVEVQTRWGHFDLKWWCRVFFLRKSSQRSQISSRQGTRWYRLLEWNTWDSVVLRRRKQGFWGVAHWNWKSRQPPLTLIKFLEGSSSKILGDRFEKHGQGRVSSAKEAVQRDNDPGYRLVEAVNAGWGKPGSGQWKSYASRAEFWSADLLKLAHKTLVWHDQPLKNQRRDC